MCNIFSKTSKTDKEQIAELKSNYEELLNYVKCLKLSDLQDVSGCLQPNLGDVLTYTGRIWNSLQNGIDILNIVQLVEERVPESYPFMQKITYDQLYSLYESKQLIPGRFYEIIDYVTKCNVIIPNGVRISSAEHPFNIIVQATSNSALSHNAKATPREGDTYFTYPALEAMEIKYDIDESDWPFSDGKGWIYYMKDQQGNEANYDFKNILFTKDDVTSYTFNLQFDLELPQDYSNFVHCKNNKIESEFPSRIRYISFLVNEERDIFNNIVTNSENITIKGPAKFNTLIQCNDLKVSGSNNNLTKTSGTILGNHNVIQGLCDMFMKRDNFEGFNISKLMFDNNLGDIPVLHFHILPKGVDGSISRLKVRYMVDSYDEITTEKFFTNIHYYEGTTLSIPMNINLDALEDYRLAWEVITVQVSIMDGDHPVITQSYLFFNE